MAKEPTKEDLERIEENLNNIIEDDIFEIEEDDFQTDFFDYIDENYLDFED